MPGLFSEKGTAYTFSVLLFSLVGVSLFVTGCVYLSLDEFMPYHAEAVGMSWQELDPNLQGLMLGLIKGLGSGAFIAGASILYMAAVAARSDSSPYLTLLPAIAVGYTALLCYATYIVFDRTPGNPPLLLTGLLVAMSVAASIALLASRQHKSVPGT